MVKSLEQAIAELERLPAEDQEQIGRSLLSHVEKLRALPNISRSSAVLVAVSTLSMVLRRAEVETSRFSLMVEARVVIRPMVEVSCWANCAR